MRTFVLVIACLLTSCSVPPSPTAEQMAQANIGIKPSQEHVERVIRSHFDRTLGAPSSSAIRVGAVERGWYRTGKYARAKFAWMVQCECNARDSSGGLTGNQPYTFWFVGDDLVATGVPSYTQTGFQRYEPVTRVTETGRATPVDHGETVQGPRGGGGAGAGSLIR